MDKRPQTAEAHLQLKEKTPRICKLKGVQGGLKQESRVTFAEKLTTSGSLLSRF
jgi:hypothetical protein